MIVEYPQNHVTWWEPDTSSAALVWDSGLRCAPSSTPSATPWHSNLLGRHGGDLKAPLSPGAPVVPASDGGATSPGENQVVIMQ